MFSGRVKSPARLSLRLTLLHSLLFAGSALALLAVTFFLLRKRTDQTEHYVIESRLNQYVSEYKRGGLDSVRQLATLRRGRAQQAFFVRVGDQENHTAFLRHADDWAEFEPERLSSRPLPTAGKRAWETLPSADGTSLLVGAERLPDGFVLQVGKANDELNELLANYRRTSMMVFLVVLPLSFVGGALLTARMLRPVQHLTNVVQEVVRTNRLDARVPSGGSRDELEALAQLFNHMLSRIEALVRDMRDSLDNVAHDFSTPLTRLRHKAQTAIHALDELPARSDCAGCQLAVEKFGDCVEEADRISQLLNTLVDIAEAEAGIGKIEHSSTPLDEVAGDAANSYTELAEASRVAVSVEVPAGLHAMIDGATLFRVLANLIDNAIKYTPSGGIVRIQAIRRGAEIEISVSDTGIGIAPEDLPRIWDRLFRGDRSRSQRGMGLGLSLVRAIVESRGGKVSAESQPGTGTTIRVTLPAANAPTPARKPAAVVS